ncbi:transmembrane protein, putative (macronuclear) [Tetrahymena thermophila SB210]|uniref:Transmembrane protein, putative n=1 Tax=Tetrahymena thermophila (strain SB210) TaxID=312017 RepID=I7LZY9_TETTS|nr:transmembrane protein, putative [Tetrahymena thermophila SB210]EAR85163.1 transmembrane protein, putative [Tetrahymena thermophila SB210]|eukprot:XP_001032826.1 transmembrane protein, putative [Tetrahymena thermophila SB210]
MQKFKEFSNLNTKALMKVFYALLLLGLIHANQNIKLNEQITSTILPRQNQIFKIESCGDVEVELKVKGQIVVEAGPARTMSQKGFQEDFKKQLSNESIKFSLQFPFVYYNSSTKICMIYLSIYGQANSQNGASENIEFEFVVKPKVKNDIYIVKLEKLPENAMIYSNSIPSNQDIFVLLKGGILKNTPINIQIFDNSPHSSVQNIQGSDAQAQESSMNVPNIVFNQQGQELKNKKKKSQDQKNKQYQLQSKSNYLNFNQQQQVTMQSDSIMVLAEKSQSESRKIQIFKQDCLQFQSLQSLSQYKFTGLNFKLLKDNKQKIFLNNEGCYVLEIFSMSPQSLKVYLNTKTPDVDHVQLELHMLKINSYTYYIVLQQVYQPDSLEIVSSADIDVLIQLKQYSQNTFQEVTKPRDDYFEININDNALQVTNDSNQKIEHAYLFMSSDQASLESNVLIGESVSNIIHFMEIDPKHQDLNQMLEKLSNFSKLYISVRAYDEFQRSHISQVQLVDNPYSSSISFSLTNILLIIIISLALAAAIIYLTLRGFKEKKIIKQPDEQELIHGSVHVRMPSENNY